MLQDSNHVQFMMQFMARFMTQPMLQEIVRDFLFGTLIRILTESRMLLRSSLGLIPPFS